MFSKVDIVRTIDPCLDILQWPHRIPQCGRGHEPQKNEDEASHRYQADEEYEPYQQDESTGHGFSNNQGRLKARTHTHTHTQEYVCSQYEPSSNSEMEIQMGRGKKISRVEAVLNSTTVRHENHSRIIRRATNSRLHEMMKHLVHFCKYSYS
mmetsp:Transcript_20276/g.55975  ORF Transcript_20276/g.55975 Transcript_20276/m.55975 type:complete len:152 (+) Transcript_20276:4526-4981(+)